MAEIRFIVELLRRWPSCVRNCQEQRTFERLKFHILGCAVLLMAGCSTLTHQQEPAVGSSSPSFNKTSAIMSMDPGAKASEFTAPKWELPMPDQPAIDTWVRRFSGDKHKSFQIQLDRAHHYAVPAMEIFERQGLPKDLIFVALVESGFCPTARSHASAVGMWQFIATTGKRFGLEQNQWIDERRHPLKAARAAADYLSFLYDWFGSWSLALAAYNAGENAVQGALDQSGLKTFWELADYGYLPAETRDYVPKVFATVKIVRSADRYGFYFNPQRYVPKSETVPTPGGIKLSWIGKKIGVPEYMLQDCNPELCQPVTPPWCSIYELCVPVGKGEAVLTALAEPRVEEEKPVIQTAKASSHSAKSLYMVKRGDTWFSLGRKYKCTAQDLAALNGMKPSQPLKSGKMIKTPVKESSFVVAVVGKKESKEKASNASRGKSSQGYGQKSRKPLYYSICRGDTLWSIAERFDISVEELCTHNKLKPNQKLIPGNLLVIRAGDSDTTRVAKKKT